MTTNTDAQIDASEALLLDAIHKLVDALVAAFDIDEPQCRAFYVGKRARQFHSLFRGYGGIPSDHRIEWAEGIYDLRHALGDASKGDDAFRALIDAGGVYAPNHVRR